MIFCFYSMDAAHVAVVAHVYGLQDGCTAIYGSEHYHQILSLIAR